MRQVKFFKIRLGPSVLKADESWLNEFLANVKLRKIVPSLVQTPREVFWSVYVEFDVEPERAADKGHPSPKGKEEPALSVEQMRLYDALRAWRNQRAAQEGVSPYMIFHNAHLRQMAQNGVTSMEEIAQVRGVGAAKATKYGPDVLRIMAKNDPPT